MSLAITSLNKTFVGRTGVLFGKKTAVHAVKNVSVDLENGRCQGIVGESGSGKTTLAKILAGFIPADSGSARFGEQDLLTLSRHERASLVQMVFQDPYASLNPKLLLRTQFLEAFRGTRPSKQKLQALMDDVGLSIEFLDRYPHQLSGGQRQRFAIARALAAGPKLLIADEPVSSLDLSVQAQIINLLNKLRQEHQFSMIVISHDLAVIAHLCNSVIVMKDGEVVEAGDVKRLFDRPEHAYTQRLLSASR